MKEMYRLHITDITNERNIPGTDIACERNVHGTDSCLQDRYNTDGHYITLFSEQLTRTFEVLVLKTSIPLWALSGAQEVDLKAAFFYLYFSTILTYGA